MFTWDSSDKGRCNEDDDDDDDYNDDDDDDDDADTVQKNRYEQTSTKSLTCV